MPIATQDALSELRRIRNLGYSVHLSSCYDSAWTSQHGGQPGWKCRIVSIQRSPVSGIKAQAICVSGEDAVACAVTRAESLVQSRGKRLDGTAR